MYLQDNKLLTFKLPSTCLPEQDILSERILKNQKVIDLIVTSLLNIIPTGTYGVASRKWLNNTKSDILYEPKLEIQKSLPPILIEVQAIVEEKLFPSPVWAKQYLLVFENNDDVGSCPLEALQAISSFFCQQKATLFDHSYSKDNTIKLLYKIAREITIEETQYENNSRNILDIVLANNEKCLNQIKKSLAGVHDIRKTEKLIEKGLTYNTTIKRQIANISTDSESDLEFPEKLPVGVERSPTSPQLAEEIAYVKMFKTNVSRMNWAQCLKEAHEKNLLLRYLTGTSLRVNFRTHIKNMLETLSNTIMVLQQQNMARVVTTTTNKSTINLPENVKSLRTIVRQKLEELPKSEQYDYSTTFKHQKLARRKKMIEENNDIYNESNYEGLNKLMIPAWMSDEEEILDKDLQGNAIFRALRPFYRSQEFNDIMDNLDYKWSHPEDPSKRIKRNNRSTRVEPVVTNIKFPSYLDKEDFPDWAFSF
ncbi:uncharacterized protein BX663DRAFT_556497 [Cokeromyces recurvatus]|uniref:uncharacterized protein n=1 Tax=Cokeromyces recurvatus TaxID=90255 RepID=UPI00221EB4B9|nr:uncharacterized protein BX663DRAFT_556497 [Cokeromyces recurvatus]KAI7897644.1 hypothetical protein BX663DRAFT_556497 [Cokeromyces recurvatus]